MKYNLILRITIVIGIVFFCTNCFAQQAVSNKKAVATNMAISDSVKADITTQQTPVPALSNSKANNKVSPTDTIKDKQIINNSTAKNNPSETNTAVISKKRNSGSTDINNKKK